MLKGNKNIPSIYPKTAMDSANSITLTKSAVGGNYHSYQDFLKKHTKPKNNPSITNADITNTRIPDKEGTIYGGNFIISDEEYPVFLDLYYKQIIATKEQEYLTEKQRPDGSGPILIDIDFRHEYNINERQYTIDHIEDVVVSYLDEFKSIYQLDETTKFPIYVFEKPTVNRVADKKITKDGIHIIIGIKSDFITRQILRERVIARLTEQWSDFPITNTWDEVFDKGISDGTVNWQLYGSRKPHHEKYALTHVYDIIYDVADNNFSMPEVPVRSFDIKANLYTMSARYPNHIHLFIKSDFAAIHSQHKGKGVRCTNTTLLNATPLSNNTIIATVPDNNDYQTTSYSNTDVLRITNKDQLERVLNLFLDSIPPMYYEIREVHEYTMTLPISYYGEGSYLKWKKVQWALKNTSDKLLITFIAFSAKHDKFDYSTISELYQSWLTTNTRINKYGLSKKSIIYWSRTDAYAEYERVKSESIDFYINQTIYPPEGSGNKKGDDRKGCADYDLAKVLYHLFKHEFISVGIKSDRWYQFKCNRWKENDSGISLRNAISELMRSLYKKKHMDIMRQVVDVEGDVDNINEKMKSSANRISVIIDRLGRTSDKKNIMTEAKELFYDETFFESLDSNPYLVCFNNGVIDLKTKTFRKGYPEDYLSLCTNIDYVKLDPIVHKQTMDEINDFMNKLFPEIELCRYMWDHLASTLSGLTLNQTINFYIGRGQNGKSALISLMELVLGEYKGDMPTTIMTDKRVRTGGVAPELVQLKGKRMAVMQEPEKGEVLNEGIMKQFTSGTDTIQGRGLYMANQISYKPQFKVVCTCNHLMGIKANDHGTWRRIRTPPFKSLFTHNPTNDDPEQPYQFKIDPSIEERFDSWKEIFASMLIERLFQTEGLVKDCDIVTERSNEYRESQDVFSEFMKERIVRDPHGIIKKTEINNEFSNWYNGNYGGRGPSAKELHENMDKIYGKAKGTPPCWRGVKINYPGTTDVDDIGDEEIHDISENEL
jgi:P4 family phage/plasmid primase-like protien